MQDLDNNPAHVLDEDTKQKALINRTSKGKTCKKGTLPSNKDIEEKSSKVSSISIYDTIMPKKEFDKLTGEEKYKAMQEYAKRFNRADLAKAWDMKLQSVHDLAYRLNKKYKDKLNPPPAPKEVKKEAKLEDLAMSFTIAKELTGSVIQDFIMKAMDFFAKDSYIEIDLSIIRAGNPKFKVSITVNDTMTSEQFNDEVMSTLTLLGNDDRYLVSMKLKEKSSL